jgi:hypothetical protein
VLLGWNLVGAAVILLWSGGLSVLLFSLLWRFDILRLKPEVEESVSRRRGGRARNHRQKGRRCIKEADLRPFSYQTRFHLLRSRNR